MKERETKQENKWEEKLNEIKVLFKSLQRDFVKKLDDRDKDQRETESYK